MDFCDLMLKFFEGEKGIVTCIDDLKSIADSISCEDGETSGGSD